MIRFSISRTVHTYASAYSSYVYIQFNNPADNTEWKHSCEYLFEGQKEGFVWARV